MNRDDIIRSFLDLHPDTPIDMKEYAIPLRIISRMLEAGAAEEREACAQICEDQMEWGEINRTIAIAAGNCADLIRERGES